MPVIQTEAIILRRTNYGEADRILTILTPGYGKLSVIAKGVRKSKSKLAGALELFATTDLTINEGRGNMGLVTSARLVHFYGDILNDYERLQWGYECIKQINRATETVTEPDFYYLLRDVLKHLSISYIDRRLVELWFRLQYETLLGRGLNLAIDASGQRLQPEQTYSFDFQEMAFMQHEQGRFTSEHIKLLRLAAAKNPAILHHVAGLDPLLDACLWLVRTLEQ